MIYMIICFHVKYKCLLFVNTINLEVEAVNIAILGFGTVGTGVYKIIQNAKRQAQNLHVKHILIRKNKNRIYRKWPTQLMKF